VIESLCRAGTGLHAFAIAQADSISLNDLLRPRHRPETTLARHKTRLCPASPKKDPESDACGNLIQGDKQKPYKKITDIFIMSIFRS